MSAGLITIDPRELIPYPANYNTHPPEQIDELVHSLNEFDQPKNIVVWRGYVLTGHGLTEAAIKAGRPTIEIRDVSDWPQEKAEAFLIADNETARMGRPDYTRLKALTEMARAQGQSVPGVTAERLAEIVAEARAANGQGDGEIEDFDPGETPDLIAPFPYFGGKARVAAKIWQRLGEVKNYIEPFCGSAAVLLACPFDLPIVTLNDADGFICNFWRSVAGAPDDVAKWADWPVNESDLFSRHISLIRQRGDLVRQLETDPDYYDAKIAGWWVWGCCAWIGSGWCSGDGPWTVEGGEVVDQRAGEQGSRGAGVKRELPHLGNAGQGVNRQRPHLGGHGHGQGINSNRVSGLGSELNPKPETLNPISTCEALTTHLRTYMQTLSDKLRRARVCCGDWERVCGSEATTTHHGLTGVLLDPPYSAEAGRSNNLYSHEDLEVAHRVRAWCLENGDNPQMRIALCGYDVEHADLTRHGWSALRWKAGSSYGSAAVSDNRLRETIWFSPHCLEAAL